MNGNRLLSVVIPAYNAERWIRETLESAVRQTYEPKEILVVDDGSSDQTAQIVENYRDRGVHLFRNGVNRGANYTYNFGLLHANGEYLTFLDADDVLMPQYSSRVIEAMEMNGADIGFSDLFALEGDVPRQTRLYGQPRHPSFRFIFGGEDHTFPSNPDLLRKMILQGVHISPRAIYRRSLFLDCGIEDRRLRISHDWLRHVSFLLHGAKCVFVSEALGYYRIHNAGNSQKDPLASLIDQCRATEIILSEYAHLMSSEEQMIARQVRDATRERLFSHLARSSLSNRQIAMFLIEHQIFI